MTQDVLETTAAGPADRTQQAARAATPGPVRAKPTILRWFGHDLPYIAMLLLALAGIAFKLPMKYWLIMIPVFGVLSIAAGLPRYRTHASRLGLVYRLTLSWGALVVAIYLLMQVGVHGALDANSTSLAMLTLLALGTFVAGVEARVWRISIVGAALFVAVPGLGWVDESAGMLGASIAVLVALSALFWWAGHHVQPMFGGRKSAA